MLTFRPITSSDAALWQQWIMCDESRECNRSLTNLVTWHFVTDSRMAVTEYGLILSYVFTSDVRVYDLVGKGNEALLFSLLEDYLRERGERMVLWGVVPEMRQWLEPLAPGRFVYEVDRNASDYLYLREDLVNLSGPRFKDKRNHINRFIHDNTFHYEPLTPSLVADCLALEEEWCRIRDCNEAASLSNERFAMQRAFRELDTLGITGGLLFVENRIVAFTYGAPINYDTYGVHIEKADSSVAGSYNVINHEFVKRIPERFRFVNREEDLGLPGLRKAKLSYNPVRLIEKGTATSTI